MIPQILEHLWQSTLFAGAAWLLTLALLRHRAAVRSWVWCAASLKFLIPFSLLVSAGNQVEWKTASQAVPNDWIVAVDQISRPLTAPARAPEPRTGYLPPVLLALWACGFVGISAQWILRWTRVRALLKSATRLDEIPAAVPVMSAPGLMEPGVFGIFRPVLLLPEGIAERLERAQLEAILAHELCHVQRRDNLVALIHMSVEAVFWFHPGVWWIGSRLVDERERACDEEVLRRGGDPNVYAEGILNVCKMYAEAPLACMSGVSGSDLRRRIEEIMTNRILRNLTTPKKLALACAGLAAVALPVIVGIANSPSAQAQNQASSGARFEVVSIRRSERQGANAAGVKGRGKGFGGPCGGIGAGGPKEMMAALRTPTRRLCLENRTVVRLIYDAYGVKGCPPLGECDLVSGGPGWMWSDEFNVIATAPDDAPTFTQAGYEDIPHVQQMLQAMLADRFRLRVHRETREFSVYALTEGRGGHRMTPAGTPQPPGTPKMQRINGGTGGGIGIMRRPGGDLRLIGTEVSPARMAITMSMMRSVEDSFIEGRMVIDRTGIEGKFDFDVPFTRDGLEDLGLRLEPVRAPVEVIVVDGLESPSEN